MGKPYPCKSYPVINAQSPKWNRDAQFGAQAVDVFVSFTLVEPANTVARRALWALS